MPSEADNPSAASADTDFFIAPNTSVAFTPALSSWPIKTAASSNPNPISWSCAPYDCILVIKSLNPVPVDCDTLNT